MASATTTWIPMGMLFLVNITLSQLPNVVRATPPEQTVRNDQGTSVRIISTRGPPERELEEWPPLPCPTANYTDLFLRSWCPAVREHGSPEMRRGIYRRSKLGTRPCRSIPPSGVASDPSKRAVDDLCAQRDCVQASMRGPSRSFERLRPGCSGGVAAELGPIRRFGLPLAVEQVCGNTRRLAVSLAMVMEA